MTRSPAPPPTTGTSAEPAQTSTPPKPARRRSSLRWWVGVGVGAVVSLPFGWLLSHAALLIFYLGVFFFALFGLVIGAVTYRIAAPGAPYGARSVFLGTAFVIAVCFLTALIAESSDLAPNMARKAVDDWPSLGERTPEAARAEMEERIRTFLSEHYPPGGTIGYIRWALASGRLDASEVEGIRKTLPRRQRRWGWGVRVVLSIVLLTYGIGSQTWPLRRTAPGDTDASGAAQESTKPIA